MIWIAKTTQQMHDSFIAYKTIFISIHKQFNETSLEPKTMTWTKASGTRTGLWGYTDPPKLDSWIMKKKQKKQGRFFQSSVALYCSLRFIFLADRSSTWYWSSSPFALIIFTLDKKFYLYLFWMVSLFSTDFFSSLCRWCLQ